MKESAFCRALINIITLFFIKSLFLSIYQQSNREKVGKFSFANRLNDIIPLLSDVWLDENEKEMKKTLKTIILETVPAKCDT